MKDQTFGFFSILQLHRDLGIQLLMLNLLRVVPALLAIPILDVFSSRQIRAEVKTSDPLLTLAIARETDQRRQSALNPIKNLGMYPAVIASDPQGLEAIFVFAINARPYQIGSLIANRCA